MCENVSDTESVLVFFAKFIIYLQKQNQRNKYKYKKLQSIQQLMSVVISECFFPMSEKALEKEDGSGLTSNRWFRVM